MNFIPPHFQTSSLFPNSPSSCFHISKNQASHKHTYGSILTKVLGQSLIDTIPLISATSLKLFDRETVVLPTPYLPNIPHDSLDDCVLPQSQPPHFIHAAQGISKLGRSFLALKVNVRADDEKTFDMVEVVFQKSIDNSEEFVGLPNNTTSFYGGAVSSIYDGEVIEDVSAQLLKALLNGETIQSPIAKHYGLSWAVKAV